MSAHVIFVHGVANRFGPDYEAARAQRDALFQALVFGKGVAIDNPYWGAFGANPKDGIYACLPDYAASGTPGVEVLAVGQGTEGEAPRLIDLARIDFADTVDLIFDAAMAEGGLDADLARKAKAAAAYALDVPRPAWLSAELDDAAFLKRLEQQAEAHAPKPEAGEIEELGVFSWLKDGAKALLDRIRNAGGHAAMALGRRQVHGLFATFLGDVFSYLRDGPGRARIRQLMAETLTRATQSPGDIVVIAHSMGGVILADCLGDPEFCAKVGLKDGRRIKALVTVGSQPGFFQEIDLLGMARDPKPALAVVETWINIFDELDPLSFRAEPLFAGMVRDMVFSSRTGIFEAHGAYFTRVQFYERLRRRLKELGVQVVP